MLRRSTTCSTARPIALSWTALSASTAPATSAPPRHSDGLDFGRHDVFTGRRLEDRVHRVRQTLAGHDAGLVGETAQRPGDPAVGQDEHQQRERDCTERHQQVVALLRRRVAAQQRRRVRRRPWRPSSAPPASVHRPTWASRRAARSARSQPGRSPHCRSRPRTAARSGLSSTLRTGFSYGPIARLRTRPSAASR